MKYRRHHRSMLMAGAPLLALAVLAGCSKKSDEAVLYDVSPEGGSDRNGASTPTAEQEGERSPGGGAAFDSFESRVTEREPSFSEKMSRMGKSVFGDDGRSGTTTMTDVGDSAPSPSGPGAQIGKMIFGSTPSAPAPQITSPPPSGTVYLPVPAMNQPPLHSLVPGMKDVSTDPVSTFSVDVDTASYARIRSAIVKGYMPNRESVRVDEMVNYFRYDLPKPSNQGEPFSVLTDVVKSPWHADSLILRVALKGYEVQNTQRLPASLVFLVDISGSMGPDDRLPLIKRALSGLVDELGPRDRISLVTYASSASVVLEPTSDHGRIRDAIEALNAGGSTAGGEGLRLAYQQARQGFISGGTNRVIIASDGDFNVGVSTPEELKALISKERESGVTLTTLGVGEGVSGDQTMESLADAGNGNSSYLDTDMEARKVLHNELTATIQTIAKDVKAQVEFNPAVVKSYRLVGYENRQLAEREFDDDSIDAGDIGAGHQVTALYEIQPAASGIASHRRYAANRILPVPTGSEEEALFVKIRYKSPQGSSSTLIERFVPTSSLASAAAPAGDTAFAVAVASYGQLLAGSAALSGFTGDDVLRLAGSQTDPARQEFINLVRQTRFPASGFATYVPPPVASYVPQSPPNPFVPIPDTSSAQAREHLAKAFLYGLFLTMIAAGCFSLLRRRKATNGTSTTSPSQHASTFDQERSPDLLQTSVRLARRESIEPETNQALDILAHIGERARVAAGSDPDIETEVKAILERHFPSYVDEYVHSRRRATAPHAARLEESFRKTLGILTDRLRDLLDSQSQRDLERLNDHERFLAGRHYPGVSAE